MEQGGDPAQIDLDRSQLEEAWEVVSDPERRRKYDAMLDVMEGEHPESGDQLWEKVQPAFVDPAAAAASRLLDQTTRLGVGRMDSRGVPISQPTLVDPPDKTLIPHPEDEGSPSVVDDVERTGSVVPLPTAAPRDPNESLRVVDGSSSSSPIIVLPTAEPERASLPPETVRGFVELHGYSGALLKAVREELRLSLDDLSESTNISKGYLEAIESDGFDRLPAATFVRGYVRVLASTLGLEEQSMVNGYMKNYSA